MSQRIAEDDSWESADQKAAAAPAEFGVAALVPLNAPEYAVVPVLVGPAILGRMAPELLGPRLL